MIPFYFIFIVFSVFFVITTLFLLFNVYHVLKFGLHATTTYLVIIGYLAIYGITIIISLYMLSQVDWSDKFEFNPSVLNSLPMTLE